MHRTFLQALQSSDHLVGTLLTIPSPEIAEIIALAGFHWVFIDTEHGSMEGSGVHQILRAVSSANHMKGGHCFSVVRVPELSAVWFKKALDGGCDGLMVPFVNTADDARLAVQFAKYPPIGQRGLGIGRAHAHGLEFQSYMQNANTSVPLIAQIEHVRAVENLEAILDVPGIDAVFIGDWDLSSSMGMPGNTQHPSVRQAVAHVRTRCLERKIPVGCIVMDTDAAAASFRDGFRYVAVGTDSGHLMTSARRIVEKLTPGA